MWRSCVEKLASPAPVFLGASKQRLSFKEVFLNSTGLATVIRSLSLGNPLPEEWILLEVRTSRKKKKKKNNFLQQRILQHCVPASLTTPYLDMLKAICNESKSSEVLFDALAGLISCNQLTARKGIIVAEIFPLHSLHVRY